jgi:hypothetical protein
VNYNRYGQWSVIGLVAMLAGCASTPAVFQSAFPENPRFSKAMNVLMASWYVDDPTKSSIRDMPRTDAAQSAGHGGSGSLDAGYAIANVLSPPPGIGLGFGLGMSALSLLMPSPQDPLGFSKVLVWMPVGEAATPEEAKTKLQGLLDAALDGALAEYIRPPFSIKPRNAKNPSQAFITGGPCDGANASCSYVARVTNAPLAGFAPSMIGGRSAWVWHFDGSHKSEVSAASLWRGASENSTNMDWLPDFSIYQAMSKRLPEWVYIYLAPGREISLGAGKGFLKAPLVLHKGEILPFVSPESK